MNPDFVEMLCALNDHDVEYLVVGAHALAAHGHARATKDLDLWIRPFEEAWPAKLTARVGGVQAYVLSRDDLVRNKKASGRLQDLADVERLERGDAD